MGYVVRRSFLLLLCCLTVLIANHNVSWSNSLNEIRFSISLPRDNGLPRGSLFEITDHDGAIIAGAGFGYYNNTNVSSNNKILTTFVGPPDSNDFELIDLGRPFEPFSTFGLIVVEDQLVALPTGSSPPPKAYNLESQRWERLPLPRDGIAASLRVVENKSLMLYPYPMKLYYDGMNLTGREDWDDFVGRSVNYFDGYLYINTDLYSDLSNGIMFVCPWQPGENIIENCIRHPLGDEPTYYYTAFPGRTKNSAIFVNSPGDIINVTPNNFDFIRKKDRNSFSLYSSIAYRGEILAGHYPTGNLFGFDSDMVPTAISPSVGYQKCSSPDEREAQSLAIYLGRLVTGVWPFGEVWQQTDDDEWQLLKRVFSGPEPCGIAPFHERSEEAGMVYNILGQRIYGFANWHHGLAIATSLKGANGEDALKMLSEEEANDYGRVFLLDSGRELSCELFGTGDMTISIEVTGTTLSINKDQQEVCSREIQIESLDFSKMTFSIGNGPWGPFSGDIQSVDVGFSEQTPDSTDGPLE